MPEGADARCETDHPLDRILPDEEPALRRFVRGLRVPAADVDDVVQEAFARACRSRDTWRPDLPVGAWLRKTALRAWLDLRRKHTRDPAALCGDVADLRPEPAPLRHDLDAALARLPSVERDILLRFHRDGDALREIAEALHMPLNTVKSHLHRARRKLTEGGR